MALINFPNWNHTHNLIGNRSNFNSTQHSGYIDKFACVNACIDELCKHIITSYTYIHVTHACIVHRSTLYLLPTLIDVYSCNTHARENACCIQLRLLCIALMKLYQNRVRTWTISKIRIRNSFVTKFHRCVTHIKPTVVSKYSSHNIWKLLEVLVTSTTLTRKRISQWLNSSIQPSSCMNFPGSIRATSSYR